MRHDAAFRIRHRGFLGIGRTYLSVECRSCDWSYDAGDDFIDGLCQSKVHAERAERSAP